MLVRGRLWVFLDVVDEVGDPLLVDGAELLAEWTLLVQGLHLLEVFRLQVLQVWVA